MRLLFWQETLEVERSIRRDDGDLIQSLAELHSLQVVDHVRQVELILHLLRIAGHQGAHQRLDLPQIALSVLAFLGQYTADGVDHVNR